jgi:hypothetical protein
VLSRGEVIAMSHALVPTNSPAAGRRLWPYRRVFIGAESLIAVGGAAGAVQLVTDTYTPPVADLAPLGLSSWVLPGIWLFVTVALPSGAAAWLAWRRSWRAPGAVLVACAMLVMELAVQIPFIGWSVLQAVFGTLAVVLALAALRARGRGWRRPGMSDVELT